MLLPTHLNLPTVRATTVRLDTPVVGSLWVPCNIDVPSHLLAEREKALCVFLNSSIGILSLLGDRTNKKPTYPNLSIDDLRKLTVPDFTEIGEKRNPNARISLRLTRRPHPPHPVTDGLMRHPPRTRRRHLRHPRNRPRNRPHHPPQPSRRALSHRQAIRRNHCLMSLSHFRETIFLNHDSNNSAISNSHQCYFSPGSAISAPDSAISSRDVKAGLALTQCKKCQNFPKTFPRMYAVLFPHHDPTPRCHSREVVSSPHWDPVAQFPPPVFPSVLGV